MGQRGGVASPNRTAQSVSAGGQQGHRSVSCNRFTEEESVAIANKPVRDKVRELETVLRENSQPPRREASVQGKRPTRDSNLAQTTAQHVGRAASRPHSRGFEPLPVEDARFVTEDMGLSPMQRNEVSVAATRCHVKADNRFGQPWQEVAAPRSFSATRAAPSSAAAVAPAPMVNVPSDASASIDDTLCAPQVSVKQRVEKFQMGFPHTWSGTP